MNAVGEGLVKGKPLSGARRTELVLSAHVVVPLQGVLPGLPSGEAERRVGAVTTRAWIEWLQASGLSYVIPNTIQS